MTLQPWLSRYNDARARPPTSADAPGSPRPLAGAVGPHDRVALFFDQANLDSAARRAGFRIDHDRLLDAFRGPGVLVGAHFHVGDLTDRNPAQRGFLDMLATLGYTLHLKAAKRLHNALSGREETKCNVDVDLATNALTSAPQYDVAVLFSGDGDYLPVVQALHAMGRRVYVVAGSESLARELLYAADKPVFRLEELRSLIERRDDGAPRRSPAALRQPRVTHDGFPLGA